jgi:hypothetical protein
MVAGPRPKPGHSFAGLNDCNRFIRLGDSLGQAWKIA